MTKSERRGRIILFCLLALGGCAWDLYSKHWAFNRLGPPSVTQERRWIVPNAFSLLTNLNTGALFGMGQGANWVFAGASALACLGIAGFMIFRCPPKLVQSIALGLVMAGAMGNLYDRLGLHGLQQAAGVANGSVFLPDEAPRGVALHRVYAVRDFLYFRVKYINWPIFNFADVFLVTGACLLIVPSLFQPASAKTESETQIDPSESPSATAATTADP